MKNRRVVNRDLSVAQEHSQLLFLVQAVSQSITGFLAANLQRVLLFYPCEISLYQRSNLLLAAAQTFFWGEMPKLNQPDDGQLTMDLFDNLLDKQKE